MRTKKKKEFKIGEMVVYPKHGVGQVSEFKKTEDIKQNLIASNNIYPITYKVRKNNNGDWLIINIIVNGVNLGLTFRNQFQALAKEHNENIDEIIKHWTSDADLN